MEKKENIQKEYIELGRYLWEQINAVDSNDKDSLNALKDFTLDLMETFDGKRYSGFMWELSMWVGLKRDAPEDFKDYGEKIKLDYPEYFEGPG